MSDTLNEIRGRIEALERDVEAAIEQRRAKFHYEVVQRKARFAREIRQRHRALKQGLIRFFAHARLRHIISAPVIYALIVPVGMLDIMLFLFQQVCFRAYRIPRVNRRDYIVLDHHRLGYLNVIEKLNCLFCAYANGLFAYAVEIASRTEQYWCPIKHAIRLKGAHRRYPGFIDYGDADDYHERLAALREKLRQAAPTAP